MKTTTIFPESFTEIKPETLLNNLAGGKLHGFHVQQSVIWSHQGRRRFSGSVKIVTDRRIVTISGDFSRRVADLNKSKAVGKAIKSVELTKGGLRISAAPSGVAWEMCDWNLPRRIVDRL